MHLRQETHTHTHRVILHVHCFSTETMATWMLLSVTCYLRRQCCWVHCYFPLVRRLAVSVWKLILCEICSTPHSGMSPSAQLPPGITFSQFSSYLTICHIREKKKINHLQATLRLKWECLKSVQRSLWNCEIFWVLILTEYLFQNSFMSGIFKEGWIPSILLLWGYFSEHQM